MSFSNTHSFPYSYPQAASRHECQYLAGIHTQAFIAQGGNASVLENRDTLPAKFRAILPLNSLMAHQPWLIHKKHIADLVKVSSDAVR